MKKIFFICSYGGSGSKMLTQYLGHFGKVYHIHSRNPPDKLTYGGSRKKKHVGMRAYNIGRRKKTYAEWFSKTEIPKKDLSSCRVIFIYKNPIKAIYSRFSEEHLKHIQCKNFSASHKKKYTINLKMVADSGLDLYGIEEFFDNYTTPNPNRNYKIYCVKYETLFKNMKSLNSVLGIPNMPRLYPRKRETQRRQLRKKELTKIYSNLISKMRKFPPIRIV